MKPATMKPRNVTPAEQRFWSKVRKTRTCWIWTGGKKDKGYGIFGLRQGKVISAHRLAWELINGEAPGPYLCHACNRPACVRPHPAHVYQGTAKDNARDMLLAGTRVYTRRISDNQCREIRRRYLAHDSLTATEIGRQLDISAGTVRDALTGRSHPHITNPPPVGLWNGGRRNGRHRVDQGDARVVRNVAYSTDKHGRTIAWREVEYGDGRRCWLKFPLALANEMVKADAVDVVKKGHAP